MKSLFFLFFSIITLSLNAGNQWQDLSSQAEKAFSEGHFEESLSYCETIINQGGASFGVYYNAGTSALKAKKYGKASLYLERAVKLKPANGDASHNLKVLQAHLFDRYEYDEVGFSGKIWGGFRSVLTADVWGIVSLILLAVLAFGVVGYFRKNDAFAFSTISTRQKISLLVLVAGVLISLSAGFAQKKAWAASETAGVVMAEQSKLFSGADSATTQTGTLHEGTKVELIDRIGEYCKVRLSNGDEGWIYTVDVEMI